MKSTGNAEKSSHIFELSREISGHDAQGGRLVLSAGESTAVDESGGAVSLISGYGRATTSGVFSIRTASAGTDGVSGGVAFVTGACVCVFLACLESGICGLACLSHAGHFNPRQHRASPSERWSEPPAYMAGSGGAEKTLHSK